jgi:hypothetical protein
MQKMIFVAAIVIVFIAFSILPAFSQIKGNGLSINQERFLNAIKIVENWKGKDGRDGEKGPYQITAKTWYQYTVEDFTDENVNKFGKEIATVHFNWIRIQLKKNHYPETSFNFAVVWCAGWGAFNKANYSPAKIDYALRVQNIYLDKDVRP